MKNTALAIFLVITLWNLPAICFAKDSTTGDNPALEARFTKLIAELRCLVCQNQSLAGSNADLAVDMRREVHKMMEQGSTDKEIVDFLVARYGDFVRYRPPVNNATFLLWFGPLILLLIGAAIVFVSIRRHGKHDSTHLKASQQQKVSELLHNQDENSQR